MNSPIEVLRGNIIYAYENANGQSIDLLHSAVHKGLVSSQIDYDNGTSKVKTPYVDLNSKEIYLQETHLSHLWSFIYSTFFIYEKAVQGKIVEETFDGYVKYDTSLLIRSKHLFDWSLSLAHSYSDWDETLPNPRTSTLEIEDELALKINNLFQSSVAFLMYHELAHLILGHASFNEDTSMSDAAIAEKVQMENEADSFAFDMIVDLNENEAMKLQKCLAIMLAVCSSLFLVKEANHLQQSRHPDLDNRIHSFINRHKFEDPKNEFYIWYMGCFAFSLFLDKHGIPHKPSTFETAEESFNSYLELFDQIK